MVTKKNIFPTKPLFAEERKLAEVLKRFPDLHLKLIIDKKYDFEFEWEGGEWDYKIENGQVKLPIVHFKEDFFRLSVADENTQQDYHMHTNSIEIYVSNHPIEIEYIEDGKKKSKRLEGGAVILPPRIPHKLKLYGITYVFQVGFGGRIGDDKVKIENGGETDTQL